MQHELVQKYLRPVMPCQCCTEGGFGAFQVGLSRPDWKGCEMMCQPGRRKGCGSKEPRTALYRWLLFDADGTLFDYDLAERNALAQTLERVGTHSSPVHLEAYRRINYSLWQALERGEVPASVLKVRRFELLLKDLGIGVQPRKSATITWSAWEVAASCCPGT